MYKRILIVVDERHVARTAVRVGLRLAAAQDGEVTFFTALPRYPWPIAEAPFYDAGSQRAFVQAARANADKVLAEARMAADKAQVTSRGVVWNGEDEVNGVVDAARRRRCDLIVVASEGRNAVMRLLTGSVIPGLITASPIPVLVCRAAVRDQPGEPSTVVPLPPTAARTRLAAAVARSRAG